jgi:hypothetical protein
MNAESKNVMLTAIQYIKLKFVDAVLRQNRIAADAALPADNAKLCT